MPMFSVVIPTYNRADLIRAALDSVFAQEFKDYEVIVVDDGSTDSTREILESYDNRIRLFTQGNKGPGAARNLGLDHATGEYVTFLDSDDLWFPWTLETFAHVIDVHGAPAFVAGQPVPFVDEAQLEAVQEMAPVVRKYDDYYTTSRHGIWIGTPAVAIHPETLKTAGRFAEAHINAEDSDLWLRLGTAEGFVHIQSPPVFAYRRHAASAIGDEAQTLDGILHMVGQEYAGHYPGGSLRRIERRRIVATHARPVCLACLRTRRVHEGWDLYRKTFLWHLRLGRLRFLLAFPFLVFLRTFGFGRASS